jgi:hypothetical protein
MERREEAGLLRELRAAARALPDPGGAFDAAVLSRLDGEAPAGQTALARAAGVALGLAAAAALLLGIGLWGAPFAPPSVEAVGSVDPIFSGGGSLLGPGPGLSGEMDALPERDFALLLAYLDGR